MMSEDYGPFGPPDLELQAAIDNSKLEDFYDKNKIVVVPQRVEGGFTMIPNNFIEMTNKHKNKTMFYLFLCRTAWTMPSKKDKHNIYIRFFVRRALLASSWAEPVLAEMFGVDRKSIYNWRNELIEEGLIQIEKDLLFKNQYIYIVGERDDEGLISYYDPKVTGK